MKLIPYQVRMISPKKFKFSISNAINGLRYLYFSQNNFRIHVLITLLVVAVGIFLNISRLEWIAIILVIGVVWIAETINTVFERLFDLIDESYNPIVKIGKDVSAAAVLLSAIFSALVGFLIFLPPLISLFIRK